MFVVILQSQIIFYFLHLLKDDGKAGILPRMVITGSCAGLMIRGRKIPCVMHVMAHGPREIVISFIPVATVAFVLKN
jgi:hypothetical protein